MACSERERPSTRTRAWVLDVSERYLLGATLGVAVMPRETIDPKELTLYSRIAAMAIRRPRMIPYLIRASWAFRARDFHVQNRPSPSAIYMARTTAHSLRLPPSRPPLR